MLSKQPAANIKVFAVWQPILVTDFRPPTTGVLKRIADVRAAQFWDPNHLLAAQIPGEPDCCRSNGVLWDVVAIYPPGAVWNEKLPAPSSLTGPVVDTLQR
jgi:hypothetical protein